MGCCLSTEENHHLRHSDGGAPSIEEEMVKEVLLETPILPKTSIANERSREKPMGNQDRKAGTNPPPELRNSNAQKSIEEKEIMVSEVSETCSFTDSVSNTTAPERNDGNDGNEVNQRLPLRKRQCHGGVTRRAPIRKPEGPYPEKRCPAAPSRTARGQRRNKEAERSLKRDADESSGRRQRLPASRGEAGARRNVSETVKNDVGEAGARRNARETVKNDGGKTDAGKATNDLVLEDPEAESLENPVVSLECFIFL